MTAQRIRLGNESPWGFGGLDRVERADLGNGPPLWVGSAETNASDNNDGTDAEFPLATINEAFRANRAVVPAAGSVIYVMQGHVEDLAAATIDIDIDGVSVIGLGYGDDRPRIDYNNAAAAIDIGADNVRLSNIRLQPSVTAVLIGIDVETLMTGCEIDHMEFMPGEDGAGVDEFNTCIELKVGCFDTHIHHNIIQTQMAAAPVAGILLNGVSARIWIHDNNMRGSWTTAAIDDAAVCTELHIWNNFMKVLDGEPGIELAATTTGEIAYNQIESTGLADPNAAIVAADCAWFGNTVVTGDGEEGAPIGIIPDSTENYIGTNSANNDAVTNLVAPNEDGSVLERLEQIQEAVNVGAGTPMGAASAIADALGSDGVAVTDAAVSVLGAIGANNANNAFDSTTVVENENGSTLERLEYLQQAQEVCVIKADGAMLLGDDPIFDVAGGPVLVTHFFGLVTTIIGAVGATMQIQFDVTTPAGTVNFSTAVAIDTDAEGTSYNFTAATPGVLTPVTAGAFDQAPENRWLLPIGQMQAVGSAANTGVIAWYLVYKPLSPASIVTAAA